MNPRKQALAYGMLAVLSWSTVATMFKTALRYYSHYEMLLVATLTAVCLLGMTLVFQKKWRQVRALTLRQQIYLGAVGILNPVVYYLVLFKAYALLPAQVAQPINYSWPILLLVLLAFVTRKPIPLSKYIGMGLSLTGVVLISMGSGTIQGDALPINGLLLALLSAFLWASYWLINNQLKGIDPIVALFCNFYFGAICLLGAYPFTDANLHSLPGLWSSIYIGAFEMAIPFVCFGIAMRKTDNPALINQICYLSPFLSLFLIHIFLQEYIYPATYIGLILIVAGIIFNEYIARYFPLRRRI